MKHSDSIKQGVNGQFIDLYPNSDYDPTKYERPNVAIDTCICRFVDNQLQIYLTERDDGTLSIPGTFVHINVNEDIKAAATRTLDNKVNISGSTFIRQLSTYGEPTRDPRWRVITVVYYALIRHEDSLNTDNDNWYDINTVSNLAFDHDIIISELRERLMYNVIHEPIAFELLPDTFTWRELQNVYEYILNRVLTVPNFRRKLKSQYKLDICTDKRKMDIGRPASLLRYFDVRSPFE